MFNTICRSLSSYIDYSLLTQAICSATGGFFHSSIPKSGEYVRLNPLFGRLPHPVGLILQDKCSKHLNFDFADYEKVLFPPPCRSYPLLELLQEQQPAKDGSQKFPGNTYYSRRS